MNRTIFRPTAPGVLSSICGRWEIHRWEDWIGLRYVVWDFAADMPGVVAVKSELEQAMGVCV